MALLISCSDLLFTMATQVLEQDDWDFRYLAELPKRATDIRRAALFYEYARESKSLVDWIYILRKAGVWHGKKVDKSIMLRLIQERESMPCEKLLLLYASDNFPSKSFRTALPELKKKTGAWIAFSAMGLVPVTWSFFDSTRVSANNLEQKISNYSFERDGFDGNHFQVFKIQWEKHTDEDLVQAFRGWLEENRPLDQPGPTRQGRSGGEAISPKDGLNQLAAFRFRRAAYSSRQAHDMGFTAYQANSPDEWNDACDEAEQRIQDFYIPTSSSE